LSLIRHFWEHGRFHSRSRPDSYSASCLLHSKHRNSLAAANVDFVYLRFTRVTGNVANVAPPNTFTMPILSPFLGLAFPVTVQLSNGSPSTKFDGVLAPATSLQDRPRQFARSILALRTDQHQHLVRLVPLRFAFPKVSLVLVAKTTRTDKDRYSARTHFTGTRRLPPDRRR